MKNLRFLLAGVLVVAVAAILPRLLSAGADASPTILAQSGPCTLQQAGPFDEDKTFAVEVKNADVQVTFALRGDEFFGAFAIQTTPRISNLSSRPQHLAYNIAFFDKSGSLIACTSSTTDLDPGAKDVQVGSNIPEIPRAALEKIASYQLVVYVSQGKKS